MRRWKVWIRSEGNTVFEREVTAFDKSEAIDIAWSSFDPEKKIDMFDSSYKTKCDLATEWNEQDFPQPQ